MFLKLIEALVAVNIVHRVLSSTSQYTIPFLLKLFYRGLLRKKDFEPPARKRQTQEDLDRNVMEYVFSLIFWNVITIIAVVAYPLYIVRYIFLLLFIGIIYLLGPIEIFERERIKEVYIKYDVHSEQKDYEVRNVNLAQAVVDLEKEVTRLRKIAGEPMKTNKKTKKQHVRHYV